MKDNNLWRSVKNWIVESPNLAPELILNKFLPLNLVVVALVGFARQDQHLPDLEYFDLAASSQFALKNSKINFIHQINQR